MVMVFVILLEVDTVAAFNTAGAYLTFQSMESSIKARIQASVPRVSESRGQQRFLPLHLEQRC